MRGEKPTEGAKDSFRWDPGARPPTNFTGNTGSGTDGLWTATPPYDWTQNPAGTAASYVTPQLSADTAVLGAGAFKAWIRSPARDLDLQVTVSEVRPDGKETFVQSGWLRTAARKLDREKSTQLEPVLSLRKRDLAPLPRGEWTKITVPLYYQGHVYRAGSLDPGDDQRGRRRPAGLGVLGGRPRCAGQGLGRPLAGDGVAAAAARGGRRRRADRAAALPGAARPALPRLPAVREPERAAALSLLNGRRAPGAAPG